MKRIETQEVIKKKKQRNARIISFVLFMILLLSTAGYGLLYRSDSGNVNQPPSNTGLYQTNYNGQTISFNYRPEEVKEISVNGNFNFANYAGKPLYVVSNNSVVNAEIASTLGIFVSKIQRACFGACEDDLPEKDCSENLIIWKDSPEKKVYQQQNCVFIDGDLQTVDAFLFKVFGL